VRKILSGLAITGLALSLAACGGDDSAGVKANMGVTVGIAMPTDTSARWIQDGKNMQDQFVSMGYKVELKNGKDNVDTQISQLKSMIANGDKLLVIGSIDGTKLKGVLAEAAKAKIPVISYDRLILGSSDVSYYATFDNRKVGVLQAQLLVNRLDLTNKPGPFTIELFAGSADDNNSKFFYDGAMSILRPYITSGKLVVKSGVTELSKITTKAWSSDVANKRMNEILKTYYKDDKLNAVLCPYDGMSIGIIKALEANGYTKSTMPVVTGQDAEVPSIQAIIDGTQAGTVYKDTRELAKVAVQMGNALLTGATPIVNDMKSYNNNKKIVPSYLLPPVAVDKTNYQTLLIKGGYYTKQQLAAKS
jgi:putative multiple sugar transport system substrate-binding protein